MERTVRTLMVNEVKINPNDEDFLDTLNLVDKAIVTRGSTRAFLSTPVEHRVIKQIFSVAAWAPSGTNMQPWKVIVLAGKARQRLSDAISEAFFLVIKFMKEHGSTIQISFLNHIKHDEGLAVSGSNKR